MQSLKLIDKVKKIPAKPGVYFWKNKHGNILYIGKAKNLRIRMLQYFKGAVNSYKTQALMNDVADFDTIIVDTEKEALILERNLIHQHKPYYNISLTDDKRYPYIRIQLKGTKLEINYVRSTRKIKRHTLHYGPFANGYGAKVILKLLQREAWFEKGLKIENSDPVFWEAKFKTLQKFLQFNNNKYLQDLEKQMYQAADNMQFEIAEDLKKSLLYLRALKEHQVVQLEKIAHIDAISIKELDNFCFFTFLFYRYGILINKIERTVKIKTDFKQTIHEFLNAYYDLNPLPQEIILDPLYKDLQLAFPEEVKLTYPQKGIYRGILNRANENTLNNININKEKAQRTEELRVKKLQALGEILKIEPPRRIILMDNSHVANTLPVSVIVSFLDGLKNTDEYRKFNLEENHSRAADVEYFNQAMNRYLKSSRYKEPDLIIVDGSYAQLHEVKKVLNLNNQGTKVIALVKDDFHRTRGIIDLEENEVLLQRNSHLYNFLSLMQTEVDRFAKAHHSRRATQKTLEGSLQKIPGIGAKTEEKLLAYFKTYANIYNAELAILEKIVSKKQAKAIKSTFS